LKTASDLLQLEEEKLVEVLTTQNIKTILKYNTQEKAISIRDTISKAIYSHLFHFLVDKINENTSSPNEASFIGVLDIFGFENFKVFLFSVF